MTQQRNPEKGIEMETEKPATAEHKQRIAATYGLTADDLSVIPDDATPTLFLRIAQRLARPNNPNPWN